MTFLWAWALLGLLIIPLTIALYAWYLHRKRKFAVRYASLSLIRDALPGRSRWRRYLPFAMLLVAAASLVIATARPQVVDSVPRSRTSIVLTLDVSRSMSATDVDPNRLTVAQEAARDFVENQPAGLRIGIVAFAGSSQILVSPTTDAKQLLKALDGLTTSRGTAIGNAILSSIDALAEINPEIAPSTLAVAEGDSRSSGGQYVPDIVVLLTDGANTVGLDPLTAADQAAERRVHVYTIGFGTNVPGPSVCTAAQLGADSLGAGPGGPGGPGGFGGGNGASSGQPFDIDETTLTSIAETTGGTYRRAEDADQLTDVFRNLPKQIEMQTEQNEISVLFIALGALLAVAGIGLSLWWNRYP